MRFLKQLSIVAALLFQLLPALAGDIITNIMSPLIGYQNEQSFDESITNGGVVSPSASFEYLQDFAGEALTNGGAISPTVSFEFLQDIGGQALTAGGVDSPIVSYEELENFNVAALTAGGIASQIASYQYCEWPGHGVLALNSSPIASYFYPITSSGSFVYDSFSRVETTPTTAPADGQSAITVTVTLLDGNGNPVTGKIVNISVVEQTSAGVLTLSTVKQPTSPTDANGQAVASFTSGQAGTAILSAQDVTDGVKLLSQPSVRFGSALIAPDQNLANALNQFINSSGDVLTQSIGDTAVEDGKHGDYFQTLLASDERDQAVNTFSTSIGAVLDFLPDTENPFLHVAGFQTTEWTPNLYSAALDAIVGNSTGLTEVGQDIGSQNNSFFQSELKSEQQLLLGVSPVISGYVSGYQNELSLRTQANNYLKEILLSQSVVLIDLQQNSELEHYPLMDIFFKEINVVVDSAGTLIELPSGGKLASTALGVAEGFDSYVVNQRNLDDDQQAYNTTLTSLANCSHVSSLIDGNVRSALNEVARGLPPNPVTASILNVDSVKTYEPLSGIAGDLAAWTQQTLNSTLVAHVTGGYSVVTVKNTTGKTANFVVVAFYTHTFTISDQLGINGASLSVPRVAMAAMNVGKGQTADITVPYFDGVTGAEPDDGTLIDIVVIGDDGTGGLYAVGEVTSTTRWQQQAAGNGIAVPRAGGNGGDSTNLFALKAPITEFIYPTVTNQTYKAQIWVENPFTVPLQTVVSQPLPAGIVVINTEGSVEKDSIVWTNSIATNGFVEESFSFKIPVPPGTPTNLPAPTVIFTDSTGSNSLTQTASVASFNGIFPVVVGGVIPLGAWGYETPVHLSVTNLAETSQVGSLMISLSDAGGNAVTNFSLPFAVGGHTITDLSFNLSGTLPVGTYSVTGQLSVGGDRGFAFSTVYVINPRPVTLGFGLPPDLVSGFNLDIEGTPGFSYLVQGSTNLTDWEPVRYVTMTNSPMGVSDYYAPGFSKRFYRATPVPSQ